jgi:hypothetical protein
MNLYNHLLKTKPAGGICIFPANIEIDFAMLLDAAAQKAAALSEPARASLRLRRRKSWKHQNRDQ